MLVVSAKLSQRILVASARLVGVTECLLLLLVSKQLLVLVSKNVTLVRYMQHNISCPFLIGRLMV